MKTLEAMCSALGWQGGTIHQALLALPNRSDLTPYKWGLREGQARRHGTDIAQYPIPTNSFDNYPPFTFAYVLGLKDGLK